MNEPRLSPSQRAYLFHREQFLQGLQARSESLFADGYRVAETRSPYRFVIICPTGQGEKHYFVDALTQTCTCPFFMRQVNGERLGEETTPLACKHLRGLKSLIRRTRLAHFKQGQIGCGYRLWAHWLATLVEYARQRGRTPHRETPYDGRVPLLPPYSEKGAEG